MTVITGGNFAGSGRPERGFLEKLTERIHQIIAKGGNVAIADRAVQSVGLGLINTHLQPSTVDTLGANLSLDGAH